MTDEQQGFVETIRSKGELLLSLITSLLDLNKLERGQLMIEPELMDPRAVVAEIKETYLPEAEKKKITFKIECDDAVPQIHADPVRVRQILINLAGNAIKFTPERGVVTLAVVPTELRVDGGDGDDDDHEGFGAALMMAPEPAVEFRVSDNGIGIPKEELGKIFDAFYQVDGSSTREYGGAGLGLSIARNLVQAHRGTIRVESEPNVGTTFFVVLPQSPPDAD
jgi:signal transduction histidine kinase